MTLLQVQQAIGESPAVAEVYRVLESAGVHPMQIGDLMLEVNGKAEIDKLELDNETLREERNDAEADAEDAYNERDRLSRELEELREEVEELKTKVANREAAASS